MDQRAEPYTGVRCLVVDDEEDIANLIAHALSEDGFSVERAHSGEKAIDLCREQPPDVVILDLDLPGINGHETASQLRRISDSYILMLSGYGTTDDRLAALTTSVDDYVSKPFSRKELVARVHAMLRRPRVQESDSATRLKVNRTTRRITIENYELDLTVLEFDLLATLIESMPDMVSKSRLIERGWRTPDGVTPHILNVHVHNLRRKLDIADEHLIIESIRGQGFRLIDKK